MASVAKATPSEPPATRPKRTQHASSKVIDPANIADAELRSHKEAINARRMAEAAETARGPDTTRTTLETSELDIRTSPQAAPTTVVSLEASESSPKPTTTAKRANPVTEADPDSDLDSDTIRRRSKKSRHVVAIDESDEESQVMQDVSQESPGQDRKNIPRQSEAIDDDGFLIDVDIQPVPDVPTGKASLKDRSCDVDHFFTPPFARDGKKYRNCRICSKKSPKHQVTLVADVTTCRRHMQSIHKGPYLKWATENDFESMLPKDSIKRRHATMKDTQQRLDSHLVEKPPQERIIPYTDDLFREAAIQWLVSTDQPIQAFHHPSFQKMIHIAARATANGVKIPNGRQTRQAIINTFKVQLTALRKRLTSDAVKGKVSLTCDAWQASNVDGYFAVTGSWIEEVNGRWELQTALLGFTQLNNAHHGVRLGQALFKIIARLGITHKIGHVTCDNASNNGTMLKEFAKHVHTETGQIFKPEMDRIRCLAHIINLATQALISTHSKSKHYDPAEPDADLTVDNGRDVVGLVRAISVKARSSAKRKQLFADLQRRMNMKPIRQLLIDMPVRWSSTYFMTSRTESMSGIINTFVYEIGRDEKDLAKREKIDNLRLDEEEWDELKLFNDLLAHADNAQHAFSSDQAPTLHLALPALEALHKAWSSRRDRIKYLAFVTALDAGLAKIAEYYDRTAESDAYTFAMLLDPSRKTEHIRRYWGADKLDDILEHAEDIYKERYLEMYAGAGNPVPPPNRSGSLTTRKVGILLRELSDDEDNTDTRRQDAPTNSNDPWREDFKGYLHSRDELGAMTIVEWWGWNSTRYPVWASLARDYLPVMASSVSSERAFSSAGITISKRRSRLKPDIVEALQFLKCLHRRELIYREEPSAISESQMETAAECVEGSEEPGGWDDLVGDLEDDEGFQDLGDEEVFVQSVA